MIRAVLSAIWLAASLAAAAQGKDCESRVLPPPLAAATLDAFADRVQELCPPRHCAVLTPGRSLYFLAAELNRRAPGSAFAFPISYTVPPTLDPFSPAMRFRGGPTLETFNRKAHAPTSYAEPRATREALFAHLDRWIPSAEQIGGRRLLVMDYTATGKSLIKFGADLAAYLRARGRERDGENLRLFFVGNPVPGLPGLRGEELPGDLLRLLDGERLKPYAPYGRQVF